MLLWNKLYLNDLLMVLECRYLAEFDLFLNESITNNYFGGEFESICF